MEDMNFITERELEILHFVAKGYSNAKIAQILAISFHTVKAHLEGMYRKMHVHNKMQAIIYGLQHGLINLKKL